jgi:alpha-amylase
MKKQFVFLLLLISSFSFAKKVKFSVDMGTYTINPMGIHVLGDFQTLAGYSGGDFNPSTTVMTQEGSSTIYSVIVDIPAFRAYEYKYVNGHFGYEVEFVPEESRVGYQFNDNRWFYLDSLKNDTTITGAILFGGNAPAGKSLIRFKVDMSNVASVSPKGVHVGGNFQSNPWSPSLNYMYSFSTNPDPNIYENIAHVGNGSYEFKYYNGDGLFPVETVPSACAVSSINRGITVPKDTVLPVVCYSSCVSCSLTGIVENNFVAPAIKLYPNPMIDFSVVELGNNNSSTVSLSDISGRVIRSYQGINESTLRIEKADLRSGIYFVTINGNGYSPKTTKLIIQ